MPLSYSQLGTYLRCPKQYEFACVDKIPRAISAGESFGSSVHNALKRWGELELMLMNPEDKRKKQLTLFTDDTPPPPAGTLDLRTLENFWRECFIAEGHGRGKEMDDAFKRGQAVLKRFIDWWSEEKRTELAIEKSFKIHIDSGKPEPIVLSGRLDRVERTPNGIRIIDYKTSATRSQDDADGDLQLSIYALASEELFGELPSELTLLFLGDEGCTKVTTIRSTSNLDAAKNIIRSSFHSIETKDFHATPNVKKCTHCPYRERCPFSMSA